jgi:hypothetical protein
MDTRQPQGENREKLTTTTPPSTPQGPQSNDMLVAPEYRDGPYPGDRPDEPNGEGSPVATHAIGITLEGKVATKEGSEEGNGPALDKEGRDPLKKEGRERNEA